MAIPTEGEPATSASARLEAELRALQRRRSQYRVALETASDSRIIGRMVADLRRLDDEISGLEQDLAALPKAPPAAEDLAPAMPAFPALRPVGPKGGALRFSAAGPDWDDEPATTLYDGASRVAPLPQRIAPAQTPAEASPPQGADTLANPGDVREPAQPSSEAGSRGDAPDQAPAPVPSPSIPTPDTGDLFGSAAGTTSSSSAPPEELDGSSTAAATPESSPSQQVYSGVPSQEPRVGSGPVSIQELEALEAHTAWDSELSPASFGTSNEPSELPEPFPAHGYPSWIALACGGVLLLVAVGVLVAVMS